MLAILVDFSFLNRKKNKAAKNSVLINKKREEGNKVIQINAIEVPIIEFRIAFILEQ